VQGSGRDARASVSWDLEGLTFPARCCLVMEGISVVERRSGSSPGRRGIGRVDRQRESAGREVVIVLAAAGAGRAQRPSGPPGTRRGPSGHLGGVARRRGVGRHPAAPPFGVSPGTAWPELVPNSRCPAQAVQGEMVSASGYLALDHQLPGLVEMRCTSMGFMVSHDRYRPLFPGTFSEKDRSRQFRTTRSAFDKDPVLVRS
jgi:hypothetical protein